MPQIFISYSRVDQIFVERLHKRIQQAFPYLTIWVDKGTRGLVAGDDWWYEIIKAVGESDIFIYVLSNESIQSRYCAAEFTEARRLRKRIIPIQARDRTELTDDLAGIQIIDMKAGVDDTDALLSLTVAITKQLGLAKKLPPQWKTVTPKPPKEALPTRASDAVSIVTPPLAPPTAEIEALKLAKSGARATIIGAVITVVLGIVAVVIGILASQPNMPLTATATLIMTTPPSTIEVVIAPTVTLSVTDTPTITPLPPTPTEAPSLTPVPPTKTEIPTITPNATEREATVQALMLSIQNEQALTLAAQERATADSLTATAESWTDTPTPTWTPTTDDRATAAARLTATEIQAIGNQTGTAVTWLTATQIQAQSNQTAAVILTNSARIAQQNRTATADSWTDTPTVTYTPSPTPTQTATLTLLQLASTPIASNAAWTPVTQEFEGVTMVLVPAGCFMMGSDDGESDEVPVHEQCFPEPFWIDQTEVTQADFERLGGIQADPPDFPGESRPVEDITWFEARDFCAARGGRLPTEAEWEYAARGPDERVYPWGDTWDDTKAIWSRSSSQGTADVGTIAAGASWVGALDMSGNVWEWVSTIYGIDDGDYNFTESSELIYRYPYTSVDSREDNSDNRTYIRVLRGGSWDSNYPTSLRAANRGRNTRVNNSNIISLRCARS